MAAYLKFHRLEASPFEGPASARLVLATEALRNAFAEIQSGLEDGSPRICLSGGAGIGKSSLASALPKLLGDRYLCVLIRDPSLPWRRLKASVGRQLDLAGGLLSRSTLLQARESGRRLVLILDQAEKLPAESLEHLDVLLGYRSSEDEQLVQCVLLANLESAAKGGEVPLLWWLDQLTTLQLRLAPIPESGIRTYVDKHLKKAGWLGDGSLFQDSAIVAIHRYTGGVPGAVSALCEKLLAEAADREASRIDAALVEAVSERDPSSSAEIGPEAAAGEPADALGFAPRPDRGTGGFDRTASQPPWIPPTPEPQLEIQQGFQPMDDPDPMPRREVPVAAAFTGPTRSRVAREFLPELPPPSGRSARVLRNLTAIGLLAAAVFSFLVWPDFWPDLADDPRPATRAPERGAARQLEANRREAGSLFGPAPPDRLPHPDQLASDPAALPPNALLKEDDSEASEVEIVFSLAELTELPAAPEKKLEETPTFEPWSAQGPEAGASEALDAGRPRTQTAATKRPTIRASQASAPTLLTPPPDEPDSPAAPAAPAPSLPDPAASKGRSSD